MSHLPQRNQNNCLNCGTIVIGKYCHECGQENIEPKESVWHLVSHFFSDITHFDGKFFTSMKDLILKPGFLSKEYLIGKRISYLNPIRMYLFTSFIFFFIFFALFKADENIMDIRYNGKNVEKLDSSELKEISAELNNGTPMTKEDFRRRLDSSAISPAVEKYKSVKEYDSLLKAGAEHHSWLTNLFIRNAIEVNQKYRNNKSLAVANIMGKVQHSIPQILFVLLPLFALMLKLLYLRHKNFYYTDHAIFTIHLYVFIFMAMLLIFGLLKLASITGAPWLSYINLVFIFTIFFYLYKSMRNFYEQGRGKTILKFFLLFTSFSFLCVLVFTILTLLSFFEI